jgi:hypothetical protein
MTPISRGFGGRGRNDIDPSRIPPGQHYERGFPAWTHRAVSYEATSSTLKLSSDPSPTASAEPRSRRTDASAYRGWRPVLRLADLEWRPVCQPPAAATACDRDGCYPTTAWDRRRAGRCLAEG